MSLRFRGGRRLSPFVIHRDSAVQADRRRRQCGRAVWLLICAVVGNATPLALTHAAVTCSGTIREVNNYNNNENLYFLLNTTSHYVHLQSKTAIAMALAAFASGKQVVFRMSEAGITTCSGGLENGSWDNGTTISGWFHVNE